MFERIINYIEKNEQLSGKGLLAIEDFAKQLIKKTSDIDKVFKRIKSKYNFENLQSIELNSGMIAGKEFFYNRIGFWMDRYEFAISVGIEGEMDEEFMLIIKETDISLECSLGISDEEKEMLNDFAFKIYYTWLGFLWQKNELYNCGVPMCIEVNSDTMTYYFNDFLKSYYSNYNEVYPEKRINGRSLKRDLTIEEIFVSTYFFRDSAKEIYLYAEKEQLLLELVMNKNKCWFYKGEKGALVEAIEFEHIHSYDLKPDSSIYYIVKQFRNAVNDNWIFDLEKSKIILRQAN